MLEDQKSELSQAIKPQGGIMQQSELQRNIQDTKKQASLHVAIRCRPLLKHEIKNNQYEILRIMDKKVN